MTIASTKIKARALKESKLHVRVLAAWTQTSDDLTGSALAKLHAVHMIPATRQWPSGNAHSRYGSRRSEEETKEAEECSHSTYSRPRDRHQRCPVSTVNCQTGDLCFLPTTNDRAVFRGQQASPPAWVTSSAGETDEHHVDRVPGGPFTVSVSASCEDGGL